MVQRANSHDDVYDRQIRLWGADAQVSPQNDLCHCLWSLGIFGVTRLPLNCR